MKGALAASFYSRMPDAISCGAKWHNARSDALELPGYQSAHYEGVEITLGFMEDFCNLSAR
jgi:hypothetical protein